MNPSQRGAYVSTMVCSKVSCRLEMGEMGINNTKNRLLVIVVVVVIVGEHNRGHVDFL